ncbi:CO dehydrogenase/acetyl-CoA synthase complex subunit alpha [uncultured Methanoregula sp.]|uniref:CO dehydrogenase/acetyl-CoA synthase complex subunit alpha n=1 Tax=uncultured Methanoregula sp. TaxID=1005933 RepID=UPI002AAA7D89|nr:CO dehydrogenase/acetyl-CoA synthase complex subunit alpha [uncultured Methanoregula sp.]
MSKKGVNLRIQELKTEGAHIRDLNITIGSIIRDTWEEKQGPTPFPTLTTLRSWDKRLLDRYKPFYMPFCDLCCLCTYGKCDLTGKKRGACGISMPAQQSRTVLIAACIGAATHTSHSRELLNYLTEKFGRDHPISFGDVGIEVEAPITRLVCGIKPTTLGDFEQVLDYCENQITQLLAVTHTGQEGNNLDFESKVFHAGMIDHVGMEVADIAQICTLNFPRADPEAALADLGLGTVDLEKPVILVVGHNVPPAAGIIDYLRDNNLSSTIEVTGICCTALDVTRYSSKAKIIGPISWQLRYIRSGVPDVIVIDEQCVRTDTLEEAARIHTPLIATSEKNCLGLPDRTHDSVADIVEGFVNGTVTGALILDPEKAGVVAVRTAQAVAPKRKKKGTLPSKEQLIEFAKKCTQCVLCRRACPNDLPLPQAIKAAAAGNLSGLDEIYDDCLGCGRCEPACAQKIPVHSLIVSAADKKTREDKYCLRTGRGPIQDVEIRKVGGPIVLGEIPGVVAFVGCANYPKGSREVAEMCMEFAKRRYIVCTSGCSAMSAGMYRDDEGKTAYERYSGAFEAGGIVNVGSCVANSHIAGAAIKIASVFAKRPLRGNYEEIADYVYNRVGAVGVAWGAMSQKAVAIAAGFWRLGIPVVVGPHGTKYRRMLLGRSDRDEDWYVHDARTGEKVYVGPVPEHLFFAAETKEEAMVMIAKLTMRPNDTSKGRANKLAHYVDLHKRLVGGIPPDVHVFVRNKADIPLTMRDEIERHLAAHAWKEQPIPDPTLLPRMIHKKV